MAAVRRMRAMLAVAGAIALTGASVAAAQAPLSVSVTTSAPTVVAGGTVNLDAIATNPGGNTPESVAYTWSSNGGTIAGSGSQVTYTAPSALGTYTITVTVATGHGRSQDAATTTITETVPSPARLSITPSPQDFGTVLVGNTPTQETFTVKNTGGSKAGTPDLTLGGTNASQWRIVTNGCTSRLAADGTCTVTVEFAPTVAGLSGSTPTYTAITDQATLDASASPGGGADASLTGTTNWGCTAFSDTLVGEGGYSLRVSGCDLTGIDLPYTPDGVNLSGANLSGANLSRATFSGANLSGANLTDANLTLADLTVADLSGANLTDANLTGANLGAADLGGANLSGANLTDANMTDAEVTGNLSGATLDNTTCSDGTNSNNDGGTCIGHE